ncbi:hypothetical protein F0562_008380 [Nyssa sinensis]|uniref:Uncharacterized protein n=1 Tax=Nyssa sinensis TaxID=561372 RepID=A0A5J5AAF8_9ASTE|nr:hypothetical protein F0562_008380 [Nyssa sinensis]
MRCRLGSWPLRFSFLCSLLWLSLRGFYVRDQRSTGGRNHGDLEAQMTFNGKLDYPSPKMTIYAKGVSVLMPGEEIPTFIAHPAPAPAPAPCPPESMSRPLQYNPLSNLSSTSVSS